MPGLIPGLLAWRVGARWVAIGVITVVLSGTVAIVLLAVRTGGLVSALVDAQVLLALVVLNVVLVCVRMLEVAVAADRWGPTPPAVPGPRAGSRRSLARARRRSAHERAIAAVLSLAVVAIPHAVAARQFDVIRTTLGQVFPDVASTEVVAVSAPPTGTRPGQEELAAVRGRRTAAAAPPGPSELGADGLYTLLLIGLDAGAGRRGARNDANMVLTIDPVTGASAAVGIPRNFVRMPLAGTDDACDCFREPLFALYRYGQEHTDRYPGSADPGAEAVRASVSTLIGREIDHYLVADLGAFLDLVDALGGVTVTVDRALSDSKSDPWHVGAQVTVDLTPGTHRLDGAEALSYVRSRHDSDYERMTRQRCVVAALGEPASRLTPRAALGLLDAVRGRLVTDIPRDDVAGLLELARRVDRERLQSLGLVPPTFVTSWSDGYPEPDGQAIRDAVAALPAEQHRDGRCDH